MKKMMILLSLFMLTSCSIFGKKSRPEASFVEIIKPEFGQVVTDNWVVVSGNCNGDFDIVIDLSVIPVKCDRGRFFSEVALNKVYAGPTHIAAFSEYGVLHVWRGFMNKAPDARREFCN